MLQGNPVYSEPAISTHLGIKASGCEAPWPQGGSVWNFNQLGSPEILHVRKSMSWTIFWGFGEILLIFHKLNDSPALLAK